jgi:GDP-4-dehydro-6-deoxy-D-mannose reductase
VARAATPVSIVQDAALFRPNDLPMLVGDRRRVTAATGWAPEVPLHQTVDDLLRYWRQQIRH